MKKATSPANVSDIATFWPGRVGQNGLSGD
jgi:hypothetical protein